MNKQNKGDSLNFSSSYTSPDKSLKNRSFSDSEKKKY